MPVNFPTTCIYNSQCYSYQPGFLHVFSLLDFQTHASKSLRFDICKPELLADKQLQSLLHPHEHLTCSHVVTEHDWPLYIVGSSFGRVFIIPLSSSLAVSCLESGVNEEISCISFTNDRLVSCSIGGQIDVWSLTHDDVTSLDQRIVNRQFSHSDKQTRTRCYSHTDTVNAHMQLITTFHLTHGPIVAIVLPVCMPGGKKQMEEESWLATVKDWEQMLVAQLADGLILVISIDKQDLYCMLTGVGDVIIKATVNIPLEYLLLETENETLYVYNTMNQQMERTLTNTATSDFIGTNTHSKRPSKHIQHLTYPQQLLSVSLATHHTSSTAQALWTECRLIGKSVFPLLCVRPKQITKAIMKSNTVTEEAKFAVSLLTRWDHVLTESEEQVQTQLELLYEPRRLSMAAAIGVFGVEEAVSFPFPSASVAPWEVSPYFSTVIGLSLVSILTICSKILPGAKVILPQIIELHSASLPHCKGFKPHLISLLSAKALEGNQAAYTLLKHFLPLKPSHEIVTYWLNFLPPGAWRGKSLFEGKQKLVSEAAISTIVLATNALQRPLETISVEILMRYLTYLLESGQKHRIKAASWVIIDGIKTWREQSCKEVVSSVTLSLLSLYNSSEDPIQSLILATLLHIGKADSLLFCTILKQEVAKWSIGREYPQHILGILEAFIHKHYTSLVFILPAVVEVILRSLDRQDIFLRKICVSKAANALEQLVKKMPMVAFDPISQRLAIGTPEGKLMLYNLADASLWKTVDAHRGPSNAVAFKPGGEVVASYCMQEAKVSYWNITAGFFGLGQYSVERGKVAALEAVQPVVKSTSELLEVVRFTWSKSRFQLTRENSRSYAFD